jgi:hypothetical protein
MNPAHCSYYRHRKRGYLLRVYPRAAVGEYPDIRRALRFPKKSYFGGYFVTVTDEKLVEEFEQVKVVDMPWRVRA